MPAMESAECGVLFACKIEQNPPTAPAAAGHLANNVRPIGEMAQKHAGGNGVKFTVLRRHLVSVAAADLDAELASICGQGLQHRRANIASRYPKAVPSKETTDNPVTATKI